MGQVLVIMTPNKRNGKKWTGGQVGFNTGDIISPITANGATGGSRFTTRGFKSMPVRENGAVDQVIWEVEESLTQIAALSVREFKKLTVIKRRNSVLSSIPYVFVERKMQEVCEASAAGVKFMYSEEADPLPVEYLVSESLATVTA